MTNLTDLAIGLRLRSARIHSGKTQQEVADLLGLTRTAIVQIESGNRTVKLIEAIDLCEIFGISIADLAAPPAAWEWSK